MVSLFGIGEDPLEKEMATHSSIPAWRIPWTEKSCGLQSMRLQRVRHDWSDLACTLVLEAFFRCLVISTVYGTAKESDVTQQLTTITNLHMLFIFQIKQYSEFSEDSLLDPSQKSDYHETNMLESLCTGTLAKNVAEPAFLVILSRCQMSEWSSPWLSCGLNSMEQPWSTPHETENSSSQHSG